LGDFIVKWLLAIIIGIVLYDSISQNISNLTNHSPNQEMYLRKISNQLAGLKEQLDDTPYNEREYNWIKERAEESEKIIECYLGQLRLFSTGKIRTGLKAFFIPDFFLSIEEKTFDAYRNNLERYYEEVKYYTKEQQMALIKGTMLERESPIIESMFKSNIELEIPHIIERVITEEIVARNHYVIPSNISDLIRQYFDWEMKDNVEKLVDKLLTKNAVSQNCHVMYLRPTIIKTFMPETTK
jgi:hypothetical protein